MATQPSPRRRSTRSKPKTKPKRGRPGLAQDQAERVTNALRTMLKEFGGNITSLGDAIGISQSAMSQLLSGKNSPSFATAERVAQRMGVGTFDLLSGASPAPAGTEG